MKIDLHSISQHSQEIFHRLRWGKSGVCCPRCGSTNIANPSFDQTHRCRDCGHKFSDTSSTIFHSTKIPLAKWLYCIYLFCSSSRGISSYNLARSISVSQPTAWRMLMLIRTHLNQDLSLTSDEIIMDEIWVGGDWKKMPFKRKLKKAKELGFKIPERRGLDKHSTLIFKGALRQTLKRASNADKVCVVGLLQKLANNKRSLSLYPFIYDDQRSLKISQKIAQIREVCNQKNIHLTSDDSSLYDLFNNHSINNHSKGQYISDDGYSSNPLEGAFSHLRKMWKGVYTWWSDKFFLSYCNEYCWRYNNSSLSLDKKIESLYSLIFA